MIKKCKCISPLTDDGFNYYQGKIYQYHIETWLGNEFYIVSPKNTISVVNVFLQRMEKSVFNKHFIDIIDLRDNQIESILK